MPNLPEASLPRGARPDRPSMPACHRGRQATPPCSLGEPFTEGMESSRREPDVEGRRATLDELPNEVLMHILGFLDVYDLLATSRVCPSAPADPLPLVAPASAVAWT